MLIYWIIVAICLLFELSSFLLTSDTTRLLYVEDDDDADSTVSEFGLPDDVLTDEAVPQEYDISEHAAVDIDSLADSLLAEAMSEQKIPSRGSNPSNGL